MTWRIAFAGLLVHALLVCHAAGQNAPEGGETPPVAPPVIAPAGLGSPRETLATFLDAMDRDPPDSEAGAACLDHGEVPTVAEDLARRLYLTLNRIEFVNLADHPNAEQVAVDPPMARYVLFPRPADLVQPLPWQRTEPSRRTLVASLAAAAGLQPIIAFERGDDGGWRFSAKTVDGIDELYDVVRHLDPVGEFAGERFKPVSEQLEALWPRSFVTGGFLGVKYWQWITLFLLIVVGVVTDFAVRFVIATTARRAIERRGGEAKGESIRKTVRPFGLAAGAITWVLLLHVVGLPAAALSVVLVAVRLFAMLAGVWAAFRLTDLISEVLVNKAKLTDTKFDDLLIPLGRKCVKVFIFVFGLIYIANSLSVPIAPLLTGLGIGGAGFAFAVKDTLEHFFGSITVITDRPFQVGDWVQIGDIEGTVEEVGFRSTRIRTFYNSLITLPNGNLVRAAVDNFGKRKYRRWRAVLGLTYDTPPERIDAFCEGVRELIRIHPYTRKDYYQVWMTGFGATSLDVLVYVFHEAPDWQTELRERHRLALDILRLANRLGVEFAFPTQTIHLAHEAGETTSFDDPPANADGRAALLGRKAVRDLTSNATWRREKPGAYKFEFSSPPDEDDETQIESKTGGEDGG